MTTFRVKTSSTNTSDLNDLNSSLNVLNTFNTPKNIQFTITPTMINNLATTPIQILPPPGTNNYYQLLYGALSMVFNTTPYELTEGEEGADLQYGISTNTAFAQWGSLQQTFVDIDYSNTTTTNSSNITNLTFDTVANQPIYLVATNNIPYVNSGDSTLKLTLTYNLISF